MAILAPGTFRVSDFRKQIPAAVERETLVRSIYQEMRRVQQEPDAFDKSRHFVLVLWASVSSGNVRFDHRPPLQDRPYDTEACDFIPPQHSVDHIEAINTAEHDARTFGTHGRTDRGDADRRKRVRSLANKTEDERERAAAKAGQTYERRADIPPPTKKSRKPKAKIRSQSNWPKGRKIAKRPKKEKPRKPPVGRFS